MSEKGKTRETAIKASFAKNFRGIIDAAVQPFPDEFGRITIDIPRDTATVSISLGGSHRVLSYKKLDPAQPNFELAYKVGFSPTRVFCADKGGNQIVFAEKDGTIFKGFPVGEGVGWYAQRELSIAEMNILTTFMKTPHLSRKEGKKILEFAPEDEELKTRRMKEEMENPLRQTEDDSVRSTSS